VKTAGARAVVAAVAVLALVGVVAVASTGSTPTGSGDGRPPADFLLDTFFSLALLLYLPALALLVYGLLQRKEIAREIASGRYKRTGVWTYLVLMGALSLAVYLRLTDFRLDLRPGGEGADELGTTRRPSPGGEGSTENAYDPEFAWIPVLVVLGFAALALVALLVSSRRRRTSAESDERAAESVAETLEDTLDDLRAEPDPRRAIIAAWARLERALAAAGLPRREAETAEEYVVRILGGLDADPEPVRALTGLYETAKFSTHDVDAPMRESALAHLARIRDDLRETARRRREEQQRSRAEPEPTAPRTVEP
jgi:hypothetical protein